MSAELTPAQAHHYSEWRRMANLRQGVIAKLDKKVQRLEAEIAELKAKLKEANQ